MFSSYVNVWSLPLFVLFLKKVTFDLDFVENFILSIIGFDVKAFVILKQTQFLKFVLLRHFKEDIFH